MGDWIIDWFIDADGKPIQVKVFLSLDEPTQQTLKTTVIASASILSLAIVGSVLMARKK